MNAALKICQAWHDAQLPPEVLETEEEREWLEHSAEQLVRGCDITWKQRRGAQQKVTATQYATYLQLYLTERQIDGLDDRDSFAKLVLSVIVGSQSEAVTHAKHLLGNDRPLQCLEEIAAEFLRDHATDAVTARREEAEDDVGGDL